MTNYKASRVQLMEQKQYKFWFCTGSQDLYGDECLAHVAEHSRKMVEVLNASNTMSRAKPWVEIA